MLLCFPNQMWIVPIFPQTLAKISCTVSTPPFLPDDDLLPHILKNVGSKKEKKMSGGGLKKFLPRIFV